MVDARYYTRIGIIGRKYPFVFDIEKCEYDRLHRYMDTVNDHDIQQLIFLAFDDAEGHTAIVSVREMAYMNLLFEHGDFLPTIPAEDDKLRIYFCGHAEPDVTTDLIPEEMSDIDFSAQTSPEIAPFIRFDDEDGEMMYVNLHHVQLIKLPTRAVEEGRQLEEI